MGVFNLWGSMRVRFQILGSSSSGNCAFLQTESSKILIDAGFSGRRLNALLNEIDVSIEEIDAVFLTHEHQDHSAGILGLSSCRNLKVFANHETAEVVKRRLRKPVDWQIFETGRPFVFKDLEVATLQLPHDAYDPVGYVFQWGKNDFFSRRSSLAWLLDLGYVPQQVCEAIPNVEVLVIEANHDTALLEQDTRRPFSVKQRVRGRHGHLSNQAVLELFNTFDNPNWRQVYLAHLSRDCNNVELVQRTFAPFQECQKDCAITVVDPENGYAAPYEF